MMDQDRASITARHHGAALLIAVAGDIDLETMRRLRKEIFRGVVSHEVRRVLVDMGTSTFRLGDAGWADYSEMAASRHALRIATGLLVPVSQSTRAWEHCERLATYGRIWLAFTDASTAYRWAQH